MTSVTVRLFLGRYALNGILAMIVMALVASMFAPLLPEERWAVIDEDEVHAAWDPDTKTIEISLEINKREDCSRVIVDKTLRPIGEDEVLDRFFLLEGHLAEKIQSIPVGETRTIFDRATPTSPLESGHYLMTVSALCELPTESDTKEATAVFPISPTTVTTLPVRVVLVVSSMEESIIGYVEHLARNDGDPR